MGAINFGDLAAQKVSKRIAAPVADMATLKGMTARERVLGMVAHVLADGSLWRYHDTSALTGDDILVSNPSDAPSAGRWLRMPTEATLVLPFTFATADAAALLTLQAGQRLRIWDLAWLIGASMTGGSTPAIGVSSNNAGLSTKGDLLGGATGDLTATLVAATTPTPGTIGAKMNSLANQRVYLTSGNIVRFDRIASAFTAGSGSVLALCDIVNNDGA